VAVIARSFARIDETNLKKQGLFAVTFRDPADYDRIREDDRISLTGLASLAPGEPMTCLIRHADGTTETWRSPIPSAPLRSPGSAPAPPSTWSRRSGEPHRGFGGKRRRIAASSPSTASRVRPDIASDAMARSAAATSDRS
jgi:hypothetical protein